MAKKSAGKKPKGKTILIGVAALAAIGALAPDTEPEELVLDEPPAIVEEQTERERVEIEDLVEADQPEEEPEPVQEEPEEAPPESQPITAPVQTEPDPPVIQESELTPEPAPEPVPEPQAEELPPTSEPEPAPQPAPQESVTDPEPEKAHWEWLKDYNYVGSAESDKYHYPRCRWTREINADNLVHFNTIEEADSMGYSACGVCHPS